MWILKQIRLLLTTASTYTTDLGEEPWQPFKHGISHVCRSTATLRGVLWLTQSHRACPSASLWGGGTSVRSCIPLAIAPSTSVPPRYKWLQKAGCHFEFPYEVGHGKKRSHRAGHDSVPPPVANPCYSKEEGQRCSNKPSQS